VQDCQTAENTYFHNDVNKSNVTINLYENNVLITTTILESRMNCSTTC